MGLMLRQDQKLCNTVAHATKNDIFPMTYRIFIAVVMRITLKVIILGFQRSHPTRFEFEFDAFNATRKDGKYLSTWDSHFCEKPKNLDDLKQFETLPSKYLSTLVHSLVMF